MDLIEPRSNLSLEKAALDPYLQIENQNSGKRTYDVS